MTTIGPDGPAPDLAGLIRSLRQAVTQGPPGTSAAASAAAVARAQGGRLSALLADGPAPGTRSPLSELAQVLRASLAGGGPTAAARIITAVLDGQGGLAVVRGPAGVAGGGRAGQAAGGGGQPTGSEAAPAGTVGRGTGTGSGGSGGSGVGPTPAVSGSAGAAGITGAAGAGAVTGSAVRVPPGVPGTVAPIGTGGGNRPPGPVVIAAGGSAANAGSGGSTGATGAEATGATGAGAIGGAGVRPDVTGIRPDGQQPVPGGAAGGRGPAAPAPGAPASPPGSVVEPRSVPGPLPAPGGAANGPWQAVQSLLPAAPEARAAQLGRAIGWLVDNLDRPQVVATGAAQLGPAAAALGVRPEQTAALAVLLSDAFRAHGGWGPQERAAWQATAGLVARWIGEGAGAAAYAPAFWTGTVVGREPRRPDLAVLLVRTFLPYPYVGGQHAVVETPHHRDVWAPCWIAGAPRPDNVVELHVRAESADTVAAALARRVGEGDQVRLRPAEGGLTADPAAAELVLVAEDTGVAAVRGLLEELRLHGDRRPAVVLHWVAPGEDSYDRAAVADLGDLVVVDSAVALAAELSGRAAARDLTAAVAGSPTGVAAALTALAFAGVPGDRTSATQIGRDD